jgi:anaerobic C4-dicarboxylate transporter
MTVRHAGQVPEEPLLDLAAEEDHVFMPGYPIVRAVNNFDADKGTDRSGERCNKFNKQHSQLTPGLFTVFCVHMVCLGFKLMMRAESPKTAFDLIYTRFMQGVQQH